MNLTNVAAIVTGGASGLGGATARALAAAGAKVLRVQAFPDHHRYSDTELRLVLAAAAGLCATPVTTPKDATRLPAELRDRFEVVGVTLAWSDAAAFEAALTRALEGRA